MGALDGKVALIVGASKGLGKAIAQGFAREGAHLAPVARSEHLLQELAAEVSRLGTECLPIAADVTQPSEVERVVSTLEARWGRVDILVHTPGGGLHAVAVDDERVKRQLQARPAPPSFWEIGVADFDRAVALGLRSLFLCCRLVAPLMMKQEQGSIIVVGSYSGILGKAQNTDAAYCAEKGGAISLTLAISRELQPHNVAVNVLLPGLTLTTLTRDYEHWAKHPAIRQPEAVVPAAVFLAAQDGKGVTGQMIETRTWSPPT